MGRRRALFRSAPHHVQLAAREQADGRLGLAALRALRPLQLRRDPAGRRGRAPASAGRAAGRALLCAAVVAPPDVGLVELELVNRPRRASGLAGPGIPRSIRVERTKPRRPPGRSQRTQRHSPARRRRPGAPSARRRPSASQESQAGVPAAVANLPYLEFVPNRAH